MSETSLQQAQRRVDQQEELVAMQRLLIARLESAMLPIELAENILASMERTLTLYRRELARHKEREYA